LHPPLLAPTAVLLYQKDENCSVPAAAVRLGLEAAR
jgi:hypothetical protein